jgi:hypothetical protein
MGPGRHHLAVAGGLRLAVLGLVGAAGSLTMATPPEAPEDADRRRGRGKQGRAMATQSSLNVWLPTVGGIRCYA